MIRGILIASLMFCHGAWAQLAPTPGVPARCNISPNPAENSPTKSLIESQMRARGLANPNMDQVRCILNAPSNVRLAIINEMIAAQQSQQAQPPQPAVPVANSMPQNFAQPPQPAVPVAMPQNSAQPPQPAVSGANSLPQSFTSKEVIQIVQATENRALLVLAKPLAGSKFIAIRMPEDKQEGLRGKPLGFLNCENCTFTRVVKRRTQTISLPYPLYDISGAYYFQEELNSTAPVAVAPRAESKIIPFNTKLQIEIEKIRPYASATINKQPIKILLTDFFQEMLRWSDTIRLNDTLKLRCVEQNGCSLTAEGYPDGIYRIIGNAVVVPLTDGSTAKKALEFKRGDVLYVSFFRREYEDSFSKLGPRYYVKYNLSTLQILPINMYTENQYNPNFFHINPQMLSKAATFKMTCASDTCFTLEPRFDPKFGLEYSEVFGQFTMSRSY